MNIRLTTFAIVMGIAVSISNAITIQDAATAILLNNGDRLQSELTRDAKNTETLSIANAPDPEIEGDYMFAPAGEDNRWGFGVNYGIEWPGAYGARRSMGKAMRDANNAEADAAILEKKMEIMGELETYLYAAMRLDLMTNVLHASDSIRMVAERASKGGEMSRLDLSKIAIEQSRVRSIIAGVEAEKLASEGRLKTLNGGKDCHALLQGIDRKWQPAKLAPLQDYLANTESNPSMVKLLRDYKVADKNVSVAKAERLPGFTIGYAHEYEDGMHFNGASLGVSIPLFASRNKVKAANAAKKAAENQINVGADILKSEITSLYDEILALDKALATPEEVFKNTDYTTLLLKAYKGGELSLADYLGELTWFYEAHLEYMDLQYQRQQKTSQLHLLSNSLY